MNINYLIELTVQDATTQKIYNDYTFRLNNYINWCNANNIYCFRKDTLEKYVRHLLSEGYEKSTVNNYLASIRKLIRTAGKIGELSQETVITINSVHNFKTTTKGYGKRISKHELNQLFSVLCERDKAIISVCCGIGAGREMIARLNLNDYNANKGTLKLKHGIVFLPNKASHNIDKWLILRGNHKGALFHPKLKGNGYNKDARLTAIGIHHIIQHASKKARLSDTVRPSDLRVTYVTNALLAGISTLDICETAGIQIDAIKAMDKRTNKEKQQAIQKIFIPGNDK